MDEIQSNNQSASLQSLLSYYRNDFKSETGQDFKHFYCPILHQDIEAELCKGHVINDAANVSGICVPQIAAIDSFYGSVAEADMLSAIESRDCTLMQLIAEANKKKRPVPSIIYQGKQLQYYIPKPNHKKVINHTYVRMIDEARNESCEIAIKMAEEEFGRLDESMIYFEIDRDYRPHVIISVLKAAHLAQFHLFGYKYVFSAAGFLFASILKELFISCQSLDKKQWSNFISKYCLKFSNYVMPIAMKDTSLKGTLRDRRVLLCMSAKRGVFAMGVIVDIANDLFCVFVPAQPEEIDLYFSFIAEPPSSVLVRYGEYVHSENGERPHWKFYKNPERRLEMPHTGKAPQWANDKYSWDP